MVIDNPRAARVSVYGDWGSAEDIIYENWEEADFDIPALKAREDLKFAFGLDFGFKVSYNALIAIAYDTLTRTLWIYDEMYFKGESNLVIAKEIIRKGYGKEKIWADSAEPKSIHELKEGFIEERMNPDGSKDHVRYALPGVVEAVKGPDSVRNGIARVQEYHIYIHYTCRNTLREVMNYSWKKDKDGKYTGEPEKEFDHLCLVGDTEVYTPDGVKCIRDVRAGDLVLSHLGWKPVLVSKMTEEDAKIYCIELSDGVLLKGTWNHPIVTEEGIKNLKDVSEGDRVIRWPTPVTQTLNIQNTTESFGIDTQTLQKGVRESISCTIIPDCIDMFERNITDLSPKDTTSTISMETQEITISQILHSSPQKSTMRHIRSQRNNLKPVQRISLDRKKRQKPGMHLPRGMHGMYSMSETISGQSDNSYAKNVGRNSRHKTTDTIAFAHPHVRQSGVERPDSITRFAYVQSVIENTQCQNSHVQGPVLVSVVKNYVDQKRDDVYSISVEDAHDFFANGILVLNCDALRYALTGELIRGHGGVVEARGGTDAELLPERRGAPALPRPSRVSAPQPEAPVNTYADSEVVSAEGPADVAPPKKRTCRVFSSIRTE